MTAASGDIFDLQVQEQIWRKQFFYNAFRALAFNGIDGDYAEFGCWIVPGFYSETLDPASPSREPENIALAYVDCDLYSSTRSVLNFLMPRMKHGMIIAFDDYFCWTSTQISGERRAMLEAFDGHSRWHLLPFMQYGWGGQSFVVEDRSIMRS